MLLFFLKGCAIDLDLLTNDDVKKLRSGEVFKDHRDSLSLKASLV